MILSELLEELETIAKNPNTYEPNIYIRVGKIQVHLSDVRLFVSKEDGDAIVLSDEKHLDRLDYLSEIIYK